MDTVRIFKDAAGEWRWNRKSPNGRIIADSSEGYKNHVDALEMALRVNKDADFEGLEGTDV
jgi:uncharacterized protein YegP (UPF0339 family)